MHRLLLVLMCWPLTHCSSGSALPVNEDVLVKVLADVHIAEAAVQNLSGVFKDSVKQVYYSQIYRIHNIEEAALRNTVELLANEPERMEKIYKKVEKRLENIEAATGEHKEEKQS